MDINKVFAELGRMHLEVMQLREQLAQSTAQLDQYTATNNAKVPQPISAE